MTLEVVLSVASGGVAIIGMIFGGGLLTRFIKHSNELAVTKYVVDKQQKQLEELVDRVSHIETGSAEIKAKVDQFSEHLKKLELLPELTAKLAAMDTLISRFTDLVQSIGK